MKKLFYLFFLILMSSSIYAQEFISKKKISNIPLSNFLIYNTDSISFIVSKFPASNKEYICFLMWTYRVLPELFEEYLPDEKFKSELYNPLYSNEPVKGVSIKQANSFCKWRSDRMNEYMLVTLGILFQDFNQKNDNYFETESYLTDEYKGIVKSAFIDSNNKQRSTLHSDHILVPRFFLPSMEVMKICKNSIKYSRRIKSNCCNSDIDWWYLNEVLLLARNNELTPFKQYLIDLASGKSINEREMLKIIKKQNRELHARKITFDYSDKFLFSEINLLQNHLYTLKSDLLFYFNIENERINPFAKEIIDEKFYYSELYDEDFVFIADDVNGQPILLLNSIFDKQNLLRKDDCLGFYYLMNLPYQVFIKRIYYN